MGIRSRIRQIRHAWNAFINEKPAERMVSYGESFTYGYRPDRVRLRSTNERTILTSVLTKLSLDASGIPIKHVRLDDQDRFTDIVSSGLNDCLSVEANIDQGARAFRQDVFLSLFEEGCIAIVPVDTTLDPTVSGGFDIKTLRVGRIKGWTPQKVMVDLYDERNGRRQTIPLDKKFVAIVENPLYPVMNEPNSTLQRLIRKLGLLDVVDDQSSSGKLDIIIQLPYVIKSEARRQAAEQRRKDMEFQLSGSKYGVAYVDGTEKVTQLNRPAENQLLKQVEYLMNLLYTQLGITPEIMNGTADEKVMSNYYNRTINPLIDAVVEAMRRAFLTKTARAQKQSVMAIPEPFQFVSLADLAEAADKLSRNEVVSANEVRQAIGLRPSKDPKADQLKNANMPEQNPAPSEPKPNTDKVKLGGDSQNGS